MALSLMKTPEALSPAWNRMSALAQPTLLLQGETDPATSPKEIEMMASKANVTVTTVPRSGQFIHVEQPDVFARTVQRFLA